MTDYIGHVAGYMGHVAGYMSHVAGYIDHAAGYMGPVACYIGLVAVYMVTWLTTADTFLIVPWSTIVDAQRSMYSDNI